MNTITLLDNESFFVEALVRPAGTRNYQTRVYVTGAPEADVSDALDLYVAHGYPARGIDAQVDKAFDKAYKVQADGQKLVMAQAAKAGAVELRLLTLHYDKFAGCSCGCSAGWVNNKPLVIRGNIIQSILVRKK